MTTTDDTGLAPWVWKNDQDGYDAWCNDLVRDCPEEWEASDGAQEDIITRYVHELERRVLAAYGPDGLMPDHEGVAHTITACQEMNTIKTWMGTALPHVDTDTEGVAKPVIGLLSITKTAVESILPVFTSIVSTLAPQFRALGLYRESR